MRVFHVSGALLIIVAPVLLAQDRFEELDSNVSPETGTDELPLLLLPAQMQSESQIVQEAVELVQAGLVNYFRTRHGVEPVIVSEAELATAYALIGDQQNIPVVARPNARLREAALRLGSNRVVRLSGREFSSGLGWSVQVSYLYAWDNGSRSGSTSTSGADGVLPDSAQVFGDPVALIGERIHANLYPGSGLPQRESAIADSSLSDAERIRALELFLVDGLRPILASHDGTVEFSSLSPPGIDAAIELGRTAADPATRARVWNLLAQTQDAFVGQALADAVLHDAVAFVRASAAKSLLGFRADPLVRAVLESAAREDEADDVRLQARWTLLAGDERPAFVESVLLDTSLTAEQRMAPLMLARSARPTSFYDAPEIEPELPVPSGAALDAIVDILGDSDDPELRYAGMAELGRTAHPSFLSVFESEADLETRRRLVARLSRYRDDPAVLAIFERLREVETDEDTLQRIDRVISPPPSPQFLLRRIVTPP